MITIEAACDNACVAAGNGPGWNNRFREALVSQGFVMIDWSGNTQRPPGSVDAPLPLEGDVDPWPMPSIIVKRA